LSNQYIDYPTYWTTNIQKIQKEKRKKYNSHVVFLCG